MAVDARTLALLHQLRTTVGGEADDVVRTLTAAWVAAWDDLDRVWQAAIAELVDVLAETGAWPPPWKLARLARLSTATAQTRAALDVLAAQTATTAGQAATTAVAATAAAEPAIIAAQLPADLAAAAIEGYAALVMPSALEAIAVRARQQITTRAWPLSAESTEAMRRALVAGVATGAHPAEVARRMLADVQGHFNGGLSRALNVARTEILDAYRATAEHVHDANADVLAGWVWIADLGVRCCPACWGMHGTPHDLSEPGPWGHQSCRCARAPKLKPWTELGIPGAEPDDTTPNRDAVFSRLDPVAQRAVMGPRRLALLNSGAITMDDLALRRDNTGWRPSYVPRTVNALEQTARRRRRART